MASICFSSQREMKLYAIRQLCAVLEARVFDRTRAVAIQGVSARRFAQ